MRIVFMGTPDFAVPSLQALHQAGHEIAAVVTQPDRPKGRGQQVRFSPVKEAALALPLRVLQPPKVKDEDFIALLENIRPDLIVVVAFGQILPEKILKLPHYGCLNVHASLLPFYRGAAPIHWAIIRGETTTGITTMQMDTGLDTGDMLLKTELAIDQDMTTGELHDRLAVLGAELLLKTVDRLAQGQLVSQSQKGLDSSYAPLLKPEHEIIRWDEPALIIHNQIRGLAPWPGAYTNFRDQRLKIRKAKPFSPQDHNAKIKAEKPGTVVALLKGYGFLVQTGKGLILIEKVQPVGKGVMDAEAFVNGYRLEVGYAFQ